MLVDHAPTGAFPDHSSVAVVFEPVVPPKASPDVLSAPAPASCSLPVAKSATSVQEVPFHNSVLAVRAAAGPSPP